MTQQQACTVGKEVLIWQNLRSSKYFSLPLVTASIRSIFSVEQIPHNMFHGQEISLSLCLTMRPAFSQRWLPLSLQSPWHEKYKQFTILKNKHFTIQSFCSAFSMFTLSLQICWYLFVSHSFIVSHSKEFFLITVFVKADLHCSSFDRQPSCLTSAHPL